MAKLRTTLRIPTEPWEAAKRQFLEGLDEEDKAIFESATLENIFYKASAAQKAHAKHSKLWAMQEKIQPLLEGIEDYGKALDVFVNASSALLCPLWGSVRVVLHIASECGRYQQKLVDMFGRIGDALPRFRSYQALFPSHEALLIALSKAYLDIIKFSIDAKNLFLRAHKSPGLPKDTQQCQETGVNGSLVVSYFGRVILIVPVSPSLALTALWKPFHRRFDEYMSEFRRHQKEVEKQAGLSHMIESARAREIELANRALQERNAKADRQRRLMSRLSKVDYEAKHKKLLKLRHQHTGTWLLREDCFSNWADDPQSDCFLCFGIPGSGKTVLCSSLVEEMKPSYSKLPMALCFYYCDYSDHASLDMSNLLGSIVKQLLARLPLANLDDQVLQTFGEEGSKPSDERLINLLLNVLAQFTKLFLVLDGIDELTTDGQLFIAEMVKRLLLLSQTTVKIFITSRREEMTIRKMFDMYPHINMSAAYLHADISSYVNHSVQSRIESNDLVVQNPDLKQEIIDALIEGAKDMFLWVRFQLDDICEAMTDDAIRLTLQHLPRDLLETYARILTKIWRSPGGEHKLHMAEKVFRWIVCARRPLTIDELKEIVALDKSDKFLDVERIPSNGDRLINSCGNLVVFDRDDLTVSLAHHTVQAFLCSAPSMPSSFPYPASIHFNYNDADTNIGEICVAYLCFADFETQITKRDKDTAVTDAHTVNHVIWNRVPFAATLSKVVSTWVGGSELSNNRKVYLRFASPTPHRSPSETFKKKYAALDYVASFWPFHCAKFPYNCPYWSRFKHLTLERQLLFDFRIWEFQELPEAVEPSLARYQSLLYWAVDHGGISFLRLLDFEPGYLSISLYCWEACTDKRDILLRACRHGDMDVSQYLVSICNGTNRNTDEAHRFLHYYSSLLVLAASVSPELLGEVESTLYRHCAKDLKVCNKIMDKALIFASELCKPTAVEQILRDDSYTWNDFNEAHIIELVQMAAESELDELIVALVKGNHYSLAFINTAFLATVKSCHPFAAKCLLEQGANVNITQAGDTALITAIRAEALPLVELILEQPQVDVNLPDRKGQTPLQIAFDLVRSRPKYSDGSVGLDSMAEYVRLILSHPTIRLDPFKKDHSTEQNFLYWAAELDMSSSIKLLMPFYETYITLPFHRDESTKIFVVAADHGHFASLRVMLEWPCQWPESAIGDALEIAELKGHTESAELLREYMSLLISAKTRMHGPSLLNNCISPTAQISAHRNPPASPHKWSPMRVTENQFFRQTRLSTGKLTLPSFGLRWTKTKDYDGSMEQDADPGALDEASGSFFGYRGWESRPRRSTAGSSLLDESKQRQAQLVELDDKEDLSEEPTPSHRGWSIIRPISSSKTDPAEPDLSHIASNF